MAYIARKTVKTDDKFYPVGHTIPEFNDWNEKARERLLRLGFVERIPDNEDPKEGTGKPYPKKPEPDPEELAEQKRLEEEDRLAAQSEVGIIKDKVDPKDPNGPLKDTKAAAREAGVGLVSCPECSGLFKSKAGLSTHMKAAHPEE